ncbi:MAG: UbiA family prenyltransferase [Elusimicrobia bacterium]|nr:UbiA family prenyltransferase [Elusimicrobiota bacterium]
MKPVLAHESRVAVWSERLKTYARFLKLEHTLFSLPILFSGSLLAHEGLPGWRISALILLAGAGARTLALALNRLIDVRVDAKNPRTANRELVTGALSVFDAVLVALLGLAVYLWAAKAINSFCLLWSWVPVLFFVVYPMLKRFTWLCHFGLGLTWALAPLGGWFAIRPGFEGSWPAWILGLFSVFWLSGFDIIYAVMDEEFDRREGLFSLPARFGRRRALRVSGVLHVLAFLTLTGLFFFTLHGANAAFLCLSAGTLLLFEHLVVDHVDLAFFKINVVTGFVVFAMVFVGLRPEF